MGTKGLIKNSIIPLLGLVILTWLGQSIYMVDGQIDWFRAMLVYGIPFGIPYMLFVIPIGGSVSTSAVILVLNIIIGALFGCVVAGAALVRAVVYLILYIVSRKRK